MLNLWQSLFLLLLASGVVAPAAVRAAEPKVNDQAEFFSKSAVEQATKKLQETKRRFNVDVIVETFSENTKAPQKNSPERDAFFHHWTETLVADEGLKGVFVLICKNPGYLRIESGEPVASKAFTPRQCELLANSARRLMGENKFDEALSQMAKTIESTVASNLGQRIGAAPGPAEKAPNAEGETPSSGLMFWLSLGAAAFLVVWLAWALMRRFSGGGNQGPSAGNTWAPQGNPALTGQGSHEEGAFPADQPTTGLTGGDKVVDGGGSVGSHDTGGG